MPFQSEAQRRFMFSQHPDIAKRWVAEGKGYVATKEKDGFNKYAAGVKHYGAGRPMPTVGPVDKLGYRERDAKKRVQAAALRRLNRSK